MAMHLLPAAKEKNGLLTFPEFFAFLLKRIIMNFCLEEEQDIGLVNHTNN